MVPEVTAVPFIKAVQFRHLDGPRGPQTKALAAQLGLREAEDLYWAVDLEGYMWYVMDGDYIVTSPVQRYMSEEDFKKEYMPWPT